MIKVKLQCTIDPSNPKDWLTEEYRITYNLKDNAIEVLQSVTNLVQEFLQKHSKVNTQVSFGYWSGGFDIYCRRKLTEDEQKTLKEKKKLWNVQSQERHKEEIRKEAKN